MKELDELITYLENDLLSNNDSKEIIVELVKKYAEAYHRSNTPNMKIDLDHLALVHLVCGIEPSIEIIDSIEIKDFGLYNGSTGSWSWDRYGLEKLPDQKLIDLYIFIRASK